MLAKKRKGKSTPSADIESSNNNSGTPKKRNAKQPAKKRRTASK